MKLKKIVAGAICTLTLCCGVMISQVKADTMTDFIMSYQQKDFEAVDYLAEKMPHKAKNINSNMTADMKEVYLNKVMKTNSLDGYYLADITGDTVPELILLVGTCEADYTFQFYKYSDGKIKKMGMIPGGHSALMNYQGKNSLIRYNAHMGFEGLYEVSYETGKIKETLIGSRNCEKTDYTQMPYVLKFYSCYSGASYELAPFSEKNTLAVKNAKKQITKLMNRVNPVVYVFKDKTNITLDAKNTTMLAAASAYLQDSKAIKGYTSQGVIIDKTKAVSEYKKLFGKSPAFHTLASSYSYSAKKKKLGNIVFKAKNGNIMTKLGDYGNTVPGKTNIRCIQKMKGGYKVVVTNYSQNALTGKKVFAHTVFTVKKSKKSSYGYWIKSMNIKSNSAIN